MTLELRTLLPALLALSCLTACATTGHVPHPYPGTPEDAREPSPPVAATRPVPRAGAAIAGRALALVGAPYRDGGSDPEGFDCSGFVQYVFGASGVSMPRSVREQHEAGEPVDDDRVQPGDLVFFAIDGTRVSHVGIAVDEDTFVHAPSSRGAGRVRVDRLSSDYWRKRYAGARRMPAPSSDADATGPR